jgi:hypothetical protein
MMRMHLKFAHDITFVGWDDGIDYDYHQEEIEK